MTPLDWLCVVMFAIGLVLVAAAMFRQAYRRAHPRRRHPWLTTTRDGRRG